MLKPFDLLKPCKACNGTGKDPDATGYGFSEPSDCEACSGRGKLLTEQGAVLAEFLRVVNAPPRETCR